MSSAGKEERCAAHFSFFLSSGREEEGILFQEISLDQSNNETDSSMGIKFNVQGDSLINIYFLAGESTIFTNLQFRMFFFLF